MVEENPTNNQQETAAPLTPAEVLSNLKGFGDIKLNMKVLLGTIRMPISQYLKITRGSIVDLGKGRSDVLDMLVNEHKVGECEIFLSASSNKVGVEVKSLHKPKKL